MSGFTKEIIARTFTELLDEKPMSKITVNDIVEHCWVNRNTFYYHFRDIPEAGIKIISQPPGKKLQNMMQLSGGEKALTAIALLFAIQNLKPSPFCLLDEIEAALDDSNVGRFAGYLQKLTKNTQFIIITHRRGTMNAADRLYGITMQEKGVSTLVSVDLVENQLTQ